MNALFWVGVGWVEGVPSVVDGRGRANGSRDSKERTDIVVTSCWNKTDYFVEAEFVLPVWVFTLKHIPAEWYCCTQDSGRHKENVVWTS